MEMVKGTYNGEDTIIFSRQNSSNGGLGQQGAREQERMCRSNRPKCLCLNRYGGGGGGGGAMWLRR